MGLPFKNVYIQIYHFWKNETGEFQQNIHIREALLETFLFRAFNNSIGITYLVWI